VGKMEHMYYIGSSASVHQSGPAWIPCACGALTGASNADVGHRVAIRALLGYPSFDRVQWGKPTAYRWILIRLLPSCKSIGPETAFHKLVYYYYSYLDLDLDLDLVFQYIFNSGNRL
jgi:hypothetical protein